jgi:hypothetical protein
MKKSHYTIFKLFSLLILGITVFGACSMEQLMKERGVDDYDVTYEDMKGVLDQAIKSSNMNVSSLRENMEKTETQIIVKKEVYVESTSVQKDQGRIVLTKLDEARSRLRVTNPEYHYSVPRDQRADYYRVLTNRIEAILRDK